MKSKLFPDEIQIFIQKNVKGLHNKELTELVNKTFGTNYKQSQIKTFKSNHHLSSGLTGQFKKGQTSWNKGKKMSDAQYKRCKATMFKKDTVPPNHKPVGYERISKDGYVEIKVEDHKPFVLKHRWIWEQANGPIPKGYKLIFLNQNKTDIRLENLTLVSNSEHLKMNRKNLYFKNTDMTKTGLQIAKLEQVIQDVEGQKWNIPKKRIEEAGDLSKSGYNINQIAEIMKIKECSAKQYLKLYQKEQNNEQK